MSVGLKVDAEALPAPVVEGIRNGSVDLKSPDTTVALLKLDAVVGLKGTVESINGKDTLTRVGVTCALCHSTVDDSFTPGIGKRRDGWANRDLNPGAIIALSPALSATMKAVYNSWGPGKYDPRFNLDGINGPQVIPPAYGLKDIHRITSTGDGDDVAYWNRYVGVTQMGGHGSFSEPRTGVLALHRARAAYVKARTAQANQMRGLLSEVGIILPQGIGHLYRQVPDILADGDNGSA